MKNEVLESMGEIEFPMRNNAQKNIATLQWKNIIEDIDSCNSVFEKIIVLLKLNIAGEFPEIEERYGKYGSSLSELIITDGPYCDKDLTSAIDSEFEGLNTPDELDSFLSKIEDNIFHTVSSNKTDDLIGHYTGKVLYHPIDKIFLKKLPRDSSELDMWYVLGKHFLSFKDILNDVAEVYANNKESEKSREFYAKYIAPKVNLVNYFNRFVN